jgi:serine/threonine protein phosphatase PrpC
MGKTVFKLTQGMQGTLKSEMSGTTLSCIFLSGNALFTLNVGDSRILLIRQVDEEMQCDQLTTDHVPDHPDEEIRILNSGGIVAKQISKSGKQ